MGKIKKIREQKKIEAQLETEQKNERNKKILKWILISAGALVVLFFVFANVFSWFKKNNNEAVVSSSASPTPSSQIKLPSISPMILNSISPTPINKSSNIVVIETDKGKIKLELYPQDAPKTVANFINLINKGFYNGLTFHRIVPDFVIQGGDPKGDGTGGPGYTFEDEINPKSLGLDDATIKALEAQGYKYNYSLNSHKMTVGVLAMANSRPNTNGSQFFIVTDQDQPYLNGKHTVFGQVIEGMDVVRKIQQGDIIKKIYMQ